ncbi:MAG TPA: hypothetical protein VJP40_06885, partial [bacterium]|nr:hypothetical protein [bacterium]
GTALNIAERLSEIPKFKRGAGKLLDLARGRADFGSKVEFTVRNFSKELTKPSMLIGMMAAPFGGVALEAAGLRGLRWLYDIGKIQRIGGGGKLVASVGGMFGESLAFTGIHRGYERLWHGSETAWRGAGNEVWSSMLLFGAMRAAHAGGTWTGSRMAEGKLNFKLGSREIRFGGRLGAEPHAPDLAVTTPTGRLLLSNPWVPEAGVGRPALSPLGLASSGLLNHAGGIAAMQLAGWGSRMLDLAPVSGQGFFNDSFDSMVAYFQAIMGFKLANKATLGRLQPTLGEAKMRIGSLAEAGLPEPRNPAARHGLYRPNIPELRLFDLNQGGARYDFRILPGREVSLDMLLFGDEGRRIMVGMDPNGTYLIDRRPQVTNWGYNVPANHCRVFNLAEQALLFNRQIMPNHTRVAIQPGDNLWLGMRNLHFTQPQSSPIFRILTELNPRQQMQLGARIDAVNDVEGLIRAFQAEGLDLRPAADYVKKVWQGKELLHGLPVELGLESKVESLIQGDLRRGEREGLDETAVKMNPAAINVRWSPVEKSFHVNRAIEQLHSRLNHASSVIEMVNILRGSPFLEIEAKSISDITLSMNETASRQGGSVQELPYTAGIRQQVRDILERDNYWASMRRGGEGQALRPRDPTMQPEYLELNQKFHELYQRMRQSEELRNELPQRQRNQLEELVYQVLERGQPVEILPSAGGLRGMVQMYQYDVVRIAERLFPLKMEARIDPWTGERIDLNNREARYRLAFHVLNFGANRPVLGVPSPHERLELTRLVKKYLNENQPGNFLEAQVTLRDHFDRATPEAQNMLRSIRPEEKATVLGLYFGPFRRRDLAPATAFQVSTWMGQAGMFREVGVTYEIRHESLRATLSLGNLGNVEPQHRDDFFSLHTHPETYVGPGGRKMGYESAGHVNTIILGNASISRSTLNILPSQVDLRLYHAKSQEYWRMGNPMRFGETPLFQPQGNRFRNWVIHSLGISKVDVVLNDQGQPQRIEIQFAARRLARLLNSEYQRQKQALEAMGAEFNLPVVISETDYAGLMAEMPYGVQSLFERQP